MVDNDHSEAEKGSIDILQKSLITVPTGFNVLKVFDKNNRCDMRCEKVEAPLLYIQLTFVRALKFLQRM